MLHFYQEITLLSLKDQKGTVSIQNLAQVLAGALAAELILKKKITISDDKKKIVELIDTSSTSDALLDECIEILVAAKRQAPLQTWVGRFASIKQLHHKAAQSLCDLGVLKRGSDKVLLIFNRTIYPEVDPRPEKKIIERLEKAIFTPKADLNGEDVILVSLSDAGGLLPQIFGRDRIKPQKQRIKQIIEGEAAGRATREVITAIQAAIVVCTIIVPAVVSS